MTNWFVSPTGNDGNSGTIDSSFKTIGKALTVAESGDTIYLRGGVYRELANAYNTPENITIEAYESEDVTWSALDKVSSVFKIHSGNGNTAIWKTVIPSNLFQGLGKNLVFANGMMLREARWPDEDMDTLFSEVEISKSGSSNGNNGSYISTKNLPTKVPNNSKINFCAGGQWGWQTGTITGRSGNTVNFSFNPATQYDDACLPMEGDRFFLWGSLVYLSQNGEFFIDNSNPSSIVLYLRLPDGSDPNKASIEVKARNSLFNPWDSPSSTWGKQNYKFHKIKFIGAPIILGDASNGWEFRNCMFASIGFAWDIENHSRPNNYHEDNLVIYGNDHKIVDCHFCQFGSSVLLVGENIEFTNNLVENMNICGFNQSGVGVGSGSLVSRNISLISNTVRYCGRSGIGLYNTKQFTIRYNEIYTYNLLSKDNGGIYSVGEQHPPHYDSEGGEVAWNKIYDDRSDTYPTALYFDFGCGSNADAPIIVHHNLLLPLQENGAGMRLHTPTGHVHIYHNTSVASGEKSIGLSFWGNAGGLENVKIKNNIFISPIMAFLPEGFTSTNITDHNDNGIDSSHNIYSDTNPKFIDHSNHDYRIATDSPAVNAAIFEDDFPDDIKIHGDCGAMKSGESFPTIGSTLAV